MKIISGKYKGRKLLGYNLERTRPTMDRVKESLFAMIQFKLDNSVVLDLFSGSGNLGLEAISMNADNCFFVDKDRNAINTIKKNIKNLNVPAEYFTIINQDYQKALDFFKEKNMKFDLIFLDPPYKTDYIEKSIALITDYNLLNEDGYIICESDDLKKIIYSHDYIEIKNKKYGDKYIVILRKR